MKPTISNQNLAFLLLITGSVGISFGGLIMRNITIADTWQIAFYRGLAFIFSITFVLFYQYRLDIVAKIKNTGLPGISGGFLLMLANLLFIHALANTSIANALFTMSSIPFITALLAFIFLKEKMSLRTIIIMVFAFLGIFIMIKDGLEKGSFYGNILAFFCAISFSGYVILLRKYSNLNMLPTNMMSGLLIIFVTLIVCAGNMKIPMQEILLCFLWGGCYLGL